jgi:hypothetical protein
LVRNGTIKMGYKNTCLDCRKAFNRPLNTDPDKIFTCPDWGRATISLSHLFKPPAKNDLKKWAVVKLLVENGFTYYHVYLKSNETGIAAYSSGYAKYPENMLDAEEFIKKYKNQTKRIPSQNR